MSMMLAVARAAHPETRRGRIWRHVRRNGEIFHVSVHSSDITFRGEQAQLDWLRAHGCDEAQGYFLARPKSFTEMIAGLGAPPAG